MPTVAPNSARDEYVGNGSLAIYGYTFKIFAKGDIAVYVDDALKIVDTDYTVDGLGSANGGNVTFTTAPAANVAVLFLRNQPVSQLSEYIPNDGLPAHIADRIEDDFDKGVMIDQMQAEEINRALKLDLDSTLTDLTVPDPVAGNILSWKPDLTGLQNLELLTTETPVGTLQVLTQAQREALTVGVGTLVEQSDGVEGIWYYDGAGWTRVADYLFSEEVDIRLTGAVPGVDVGPAITAAHAIGNVAIIPPGTWLWSTTVGVGTDKKIRGYGDESILDAGADDLRFRIAGDNWDLGYFRIISSRTTANSVGGFIDIDSTTTPSNNGRIHHISSNCPNHGQNLVGIKGHLNGKVANVEIDHNRVDAQGRMGIELVTQTGSGESVTKVKIHDNIIMNTGGIAHGMGVSLSAADSLTDVDVVGNHIEDCSNAWVELVGMIGNVNVSGNTLAGATSNGIIHSGTAPAVGPVRIFNNQCEPDATGSWQFTQGAVELFDNLIYATGSGIQLKFPRCVVRNNTIVSSGIYAIIVDNNPDCTIFDNRLSTEPSGAQIAIVRFFNVGATNNGAFRNRLIKGTAGNYIDENNGAVGNMFWENRGPLGEIRDTWPSSKNFVMRSTLPVTLEVATVGSWQAYLAKFRMAGVENNGANTLHSYREISFRAINASNAGLIANTVISEAGVTVAVSFGIGTITFTPTPDAGTPNYLYDIDILTRF